MVWFRRIGAAAFVLMLAPSCHHGGSTSGTTEALSRSVLPPCPAEAPASTTLPYQHPLHALASFWLERMEGDVDQPLMSPEQIEAHNLQVRTIEKDGWLRGRWDLLALKLDPPRIRQWFAESLDKLRKAASEGKRVLASGERPDALLKQLQRKLDRMRPADETRVVIRGTPLRCYPTERGLFEKAWDLQFDLMQCAQLRMGEPVRVFGKVERYFYVWSSYANGWVDSKDLTPALDTQQAYAYLKPDRFVVVQHDRLPLWDKEQGGRPVARARLGLHLPLIREHESSLEVTFPSTTGLGSAWVLYKEGVSLGHPSLTRRSLMTRAFDLLNTPYGWGGVGNHRDCSRMLMDLFGVFGVLLPRNSWHQSKAGVRQLEVGQLGEAAKVAAIEQAARRAVVLLYLPGHIMLYVGRDGGHLYALSLLSGYLVPCRQGGETMMRVNRAAVTSLELGRGSSRTSFIERISTLVLFEPQTPVEPAS